VSAMPLYEFNCRSCGIHFEVLVSLGAEKDVHCEACGSTEVRKCVSSFGIGGGGDRVKSDSSACTSCTSDSCATCR
jgi:putative FmdB family regulatory protein